jgi:hypothetical protein
LGHFSNLLSFGTVRAIFVLAGKSIPVFSHFFKDALFGSATTRPGMPDVFFKPKFQFGKKFQGLRLKNVDIFYGHFEYFTNILDSL